MRTVGPSPLAVVCEWRQPVRADGPVMFLQPLTQPTFANRNEPLARGGAGQRRRSALAAAGVGGAISFLMPCIGKRVDYFFCLKDTNSVQSYSLIFFMVIFFLLSIK